MKFSFRLFWRSSVSDKLSYQNTSESLLRTREAFGAQGQSVMEASLLLFPEDPLKWQIIESVNYAHENGLDKKQIREWKWPL